MAKRQTRLAGLDDRILGITAADSFTLSAAATVTFTLNRKAPGRKVKHRCVKPTATNKQHKQCSRLAAVHGKLVQTARAGANSSTFTSEIAGHKLVPGSYQLTATPMGGTPQQVTFKLIH